MKSAKTILALACLALSVAGAVVGQLPAKNSPGQKSAPGTGLVRGKKIYDERCKICHFSGSAAKKVGPGLKNFYKRGAFADRSKVNDEKVRGLIENGGKDMPGFKDQLNADQVRDLIAYMKTI